MRPLHIPKIRALDLTERHWRDLDLRKALWKVLGDRPRMTVLDKPLMHAFGDMTGQPTVCFGSKVAPVAVRRPPSFDLGRP